MGYKINSLADLTVHPGITLYIFVINGDYRERCFKTLQDHFWTIADRIGKHAAIVDTNNKYSNEFYGEICRQFLGKDIRDIWDALPALLVTDAQPAAITEHTMRLFAPLKWAEQEFGGLGTFFRGLAAFAYNGSPSFLSHFKPKNRFWELAGKTVEIKFPLGPFAVNVNGFLKTLKQKPSTMARLQRKFQPK